MLAWRTRFMFSVSVSITSLALEAGRVHGRHARRLLGRDGFEQRAVNLRLRRSAAAALSSISTGRLFVDVIA